MNTDAILRHAVLTWLLFPAIAIPVSLTAHRLGHTDFFPRLLVWFVIIPIFLAASYLGELPFFVLLTGCCTASAIELVWLEAASRTLARYAATLSISLIWIIWAQIAMRFPWQVIPCVMTASIWVYYLKSKHTGSWLPPYLALITGSGMSCWILLQKDYGFGVVLFAFSVVVITDIMAFVFGKMLGGLRLCPVISPNKTLAGFIGGGLGAVLAAYIFWFAVPELNFISVTAAGILLGVSGSCGDLAASMVKRHHGIKDFSGMLGPVGGMLDRLDSLIGAGWIFLIFLKSHTLLLM